MRWNEEQCFEINASPQPCEQRAYSTSPLHEIEAAAGIRVGAKP